MVFYKILILCLVLTVGLQYELKKPTIFVTMLVRNKAHILPYFLSNFQNLNYPKERISLWIRSDHNKDRSLEILKLWVTSVKDLYHSIFTEFVDSGSEYPGEMGPGDWTKARFNHIIDLREASLNEARKAWADYYLAIDADVILTNTDTLNLLIAKGKTVIAPMLKSEGFYSNFWCGMTDEYYYQRTEEYKPILDRDNVGCFEVPMVHTCVLVNLRKYESDLLTYVPSKVSINGPKIPTDDIIAFALGAKSNNISLNVCNDEIYGFVTPPLDKEDELQIDFEQLRNIKVEILNNELLPFIDNNLFGPYVIHHPRKDSLGFDKIFMINLLRRPERRERMLACFEELDMDVTVVDAVDGQTLNETFLEGIKFMPGFIDPYHKRPMKLGEIGCFLSHFYIWEEIVEKGYQSALVLEDDIRFEPYFRKKVEQLMEEVRRIENWDLVYLGRKRLQHVDEPFVEGSQILVKVGYSYWTLGYALSNRGAKKLLDGDPLSKLVPVDEYLPILFDKHPEESYKSHFPQRNLVAFSAVPLLVYPIRYTGEEGYVSDTEDSVIIPDNLQPELREDL